MMEDICLDVTLKETWLRLFRKAINIMKDVAVFITFRTISKSILRLSVVDHFACGGMYIDIPIHEHNNTNVWINLASADLFELSKKLSKFHHDLAIVIHQRHFALFLNANTHAPVLPNTTFPNFAPLNNQFHALDTNCYHSFRFVSQDLLYSLTCLNLGSAVVNFVLAKTGQLSLTNRHEWGFTNIVKQLKGDIFDRSSPKIILNQTYLIKFTKLLVNTLVNSSSNTCFLLVPKTNTQPLVIKFLLANDTFQDYLIFPFVPLLHHQTEGSQASIKMNT